MTVWLSEAGPLGALAALLSLIAVGVWRGWVVPRSTVERELRQQEQITGIYKDALATERLRGDVMQGDQVKLMRELTEALQRSKPAEP